MKKLGKLIVAGLLVLSLAGCGAKKSDSAYKTDVEPSALKDAVVTAVTEDNYWPNMDIDAAMLAETYGVTEDMYESYYAAMPMISVNIDTLIIVKAKAGKETAVSDALSAYQKKNEENAVMYPMNLPKVQAAKVQAYGSYVCFVQLGADSSMLDDEAALKANEEANKKALDAIETQLKK